jgi:hypothetical protein
MTDHARFLAATLGLQADTQTNAKAMIEAQYGKGCLYNEPMTK